MLFHLSDLEVEHGIIWQLWEPRITRSCQGTGSQAGRVARRLRGQSR